LEREKIRTKGRLEFSVQLPEKSPRGSGRVLVIWSWTFDFHSYLYQRSSRTARSSIGLRVARKLPKSRKSPATIKLFSIGRDLAGVVAVSENPENPRSYGSGQWTESGWTGAGSTNPQNHGDSHSGTDCAKKRRGCQRAAEPCSRPPGPGSTAIGRAAGVEGQSTRTRGRYRDLRRSESRVLPGANGGS
jgi:hypothetical protein